MRDPVLAGFLSLVIPGVGQIYNGRISGGSSVAHFYAGILAGNGRNARLDLPPRLRVLRLLIRERTSNPSVN